MKKENTKLLKIALNAGTYDEDRDLCFEWPSGESMTVPDEAYTIQEIMDRYSGGIQLSVEHDGQFSDTDDFEDFDPIINDPTDLDYVRKEIEALHKRKAEADKAKLELHKKQIKTDTESGQVNEAKKTKSKEPNEPKTDPGSVE